MIADRPFPPPRLPAVRPPHELEAEDPRRWLLPVPYDRLALGDAEEGGGGAVAATPARVGESGAAPKPLRTPSQLPLQDN